MNFHIWLAAVLVAACALGTTTSSEYLDFTAYGTDFPAADPHPLTHDKRGHVLTEGVRIISSPLVNNAGHTGQGVKIAVLDAGFDIRNSEIANNIEGHMSFISGDINRGDITNGGDTEHGTGVSEIIVDIAPDARLLLYNFHTDVEFLGLVDHLVSRGDIDIVSMSLGWYNDVGPADGTSAIAKKVDEARKSGILWINAAGNEAQEHWQGQFSDPDGDGWHNFRGSDRTINVDVPGGDLLTVILSWDDWTSPSQDYDLYVLDANGTEVDESRLVQGEPTVPPVEIVNVPASNDATYQIAIRKHSATRDVTFQLYSAGQHSFNEYRVAASSLSLPADARGAMAVGATNWETDSLEPYSSQGPTLDGRIKPDIIAPARVSTTAYGPGGFGGTSAAAPHVAGAAALAMSKYPDATADQIQKLLESIVNSRHAKSSQDGTGRLDVRMLADSDVLALDADNRDCTSDKTCFFPETLRVSAGDAVRWVNAGTSPITITGSGSESFEARLDSRGDSYSRVFASNGTFAYSSTTHPWASGRIMVSGSGTSGDLADLIRELRTSLSALTTKVASLETAVADLTTRVAALEGGSTPPPEPMTGIRGKVYQDTNGNGVLDAGEPGVPGKTILTVNTANHSDVTRTTTDSNGDYSVRLAAGGYLVQIEGGGPQGYAYVTIPDGTVLVRNLIP